MFELIKELHNAARDAAHYERYMQEHDYQEQECYMPGEDAPPAPKWMRVLPLPVVHRIWRFRGWLERHTLYHFAVYARWAVLERTVCRWRGHDLVDTGSWGNPESGGEDHTCRRCQRNFRHVYY